ncbi:MAG TPA: hypothetical protein EYO02_07370 [Rhodospirillales bacterium]|nr:hypothetical protein [Rhodospirillales bacterium]
MKRIVGHINDRYQKFQENLSEELSEEYKDIAALITFEILNRQLGEGVGGGRKRRKRRRKRRKRRSPL